MRRVPHQRDGRLPASSTSGAPFFSNANGLAEHLFCDVLRGVKNLADENVIVLDGEKNVVGFVAVAAKSAPEVAGRAADAGKLRKKLECVLKTFYVAVGLRLAEIQEGGIQYNVKRRAGVRRKFEAGHDITARDVGERGRKCLEGCRQPPRRFRAGSKLHGNGAPALPPGAGSMRRLRPWLAEPKA